MSSKQSYAVFGLGRYGRSVARELAAGGAEVLAVDMDEDIVNAAIADIPYCKCANVTDPEVMRQLGVANVDVAIISMAGNALHQAQALESRAHTLSQAVRNFRLQQGTAEEAQALVLRAVALGRQLGAGAELLRSVTDKAQDFHDRDMYVFVLDRGGGLPRLRRQRSQGGYAGARHRRGGRRAPAGGYMGTGRSRAGLGGI